MARRVEEGALALAVLEIVGLSDDRPAMLADALAERGDVFDSEHHRLRHLLATRSHTTVTRVGHDQRALAKAQLRPVAGVDSDSLDEPEHLNEPVDRSADVGIGEFGDHRSEGRRAIRPHQWSVGLPGAGHSRARPVTVPAIGSCSTTLRSAPVTVPYRRLSALGERRVGCSATSLSPPGVGLRCSLPGHRSATIRAMSAANVQLARRGYEAAARGDLEALRDFLDPEVRWHGGDPSAPEACRNREQAIEFMRRAQGRRGIGELVDVIDAGDQVVVIMRSKPEGAEPAALSANLTTFRDGKAVEMVHFPDPEDALAAAGV